MSNKTAPIWIPLAVLAVVVGALVTIRSSKSNGIWSQKYDLKPQLGAQLPVDAQLTESDGSTHMFGEYFRSGRPVMLLPIFYGCNGVCYTETEALIKTLLVETALSTKKSVDSVVPGRDFDLVVVSIHPKETPALANAKRTEFLDAFHAAWNNQTPQRQQELGAYLDKGVHFTVGKPAEVQKLTDAMGFYYSFDEKRNWVNHPAAAAFLAPSAKIVAYNTGSEFQTKNLRNNVHEATKGKVQPIGDVFLLGCFRMEAASPRTRSIVFILNSCVIATFLGAIFMIWRYNKSYPSNTLFSGSPKDEAGDPHQS